MSTDYCTYKEQLTLSAVKEIERLVCDFKVVVPKCKKERMWSITYQGNSLAIFLSDNLENIELLTRYGSNCCDEILKIISCYSGVTLYDEFEYFKLIDKDRENTILVIDFTEDEKNTGLDFAKKIGKTAIEINACSLINDTKNFFDILDSFYVYNLWFPVTGRVGSKTNLIELFERYWKGDIDEVCLYQGDRKIM